MSDATKSTADPAAPRFVARLEENTSIKLIGLGGVGGIAARSGVS